MRWEYEKERQTSPNPPYSLLTVDLEDTKLEEEVIGDGEEWTGEIVLALPQT
jgi:hypothetical protein